MHKLATAEEVCRLTAKLRDLDREAVRCIADTLVNRQATRLLLWDSEELAHTLVVLEKILVSVK